MAKIKNLASYIDHTLLKPEATEAQIQQLCKEAQKYRFASVCVNSSRVALCSKLLKKSKVKPIAVVGFPLGAASTKSKAFEAKQAIKDGAKEIDMVIAIGQLKDGNYSYVLNDIKKVVKAAGTKPVKVILETSFLTNEEKLIACALAEQAGAAFVKTSTGFHGGATLEDVKLMRSTVKKTIGVKASGGIRNTADAEAMIAAGANRLGTSASVAIIMNLGKSAESNVY